MQNKHSLNKLNREELFEYIQSLEGDIFDFESSLNNKNIELSKYKLLIKDILHSSNEILNTDRFSDEINYEEAIKNLNEYIKDYLNNNNLYL